MNKRPSLLEEDFEDSLDADDSSFEDSSGGEATPPPSVSPPLDNSGMDSRCPMQLKEYPTTFCPMAVIRLKAVKSAESFPSEEEEAGMPGCDFAINHQQSCYCWFRYARDYLSRETSHYEIAHLLNIPEEEVVAIEVAAMEKVKRSAQISEIDRSFDKGGVFENAGEFPHHELHVVRKK